MLEDVLKNLKERELDHIDGKRLKIEEMYKNLSPAIERLSSLLGADPTIMVEACNLVALHYQDQEWYDILRYVQAFHVTYNRLLYAAVKDDK